MKRESHRGSLTDFVSEVERFKDVFDELVEIAIDAVQGVMFKSRANNEIKLS